MMTIPQFARMCLTMAAVPTAETVKYGHDRWVAIYRCKACSKPLTKDQQHCSDGVCPYCGAVTAGREVGCIKGSVLVAGGSTLGDSIKSLICTDRVL